MASWLCWSSAGRRAAARLLHVHHNEDEWFYVIEGELTLWVGGETIVAPAGSFVYGPRDVPHTFLVTSTEARFLMVTAPPIRRLRACAVRAGGHAHAPPHPSSPPALST